MFKTIAKLIKDSSEKKLASRILRNNINNHGKEHQLRKTQEELAECIVAINHFMEIAARHGNIPCTHPFFDCDNCPNKTSCPVRPEYISLCMEVADCLIVLAQMEHILKPKYINYHFNTVLRSMARQQGIAVPDGLLLREFK